MLRVCHIISGDLWAGAEVMVCHLLKGLKAYGTIDLLTVLLNEGRLAEEIRRMGINVHVVDESKISFFSIFISTRGILRKWDPDVIHSHHYKENILAYLISQSLRRATLIATQHGKPGAHGKKSKHRLISKSNLFVLSRRFHRVVAVSQEIKNAFVDRYGFRKNRLSVIHNGIKIPDVPPKRENGNIFVIGSAGRLFPVKDYSLMVEIAKVILARKNNIRFQIAGDGPELPKLQARIQTYGLTETFKLKGHVDDMSSFYRELDLYLNTSIHEGIPFSILEAMANGIPVVAPKVGGLTEVVDNEVQGYLLEGRNPEAFAEKCLLLYEKKALRQSMSQAARGKVLHSFSMEKMAQQYYSLYADLTAKS